MTNKPIWNVKGTLCDMLQFLNRSLPWILVLYMVVFLTPYKSNSWQIINLLAGLVYNLNWMNETQTEKDLGIRV